MGRKVNQAELAEIVGKTDVTIWQWQKEGMPIERVNTRGQSNVYDTADVIAWIENRAEKRVRDESPRDALARAQTKLIEQTLAEKSRALVPVAEMEAGFSRMVVAARQRLLQIPGLMRGALDEGQVAALEEQLLEALQELSNHGPSAGSAGSDPAAMAAAEEAGGRGVGGDEAPAERQVAVPGAVPALDHALPA